MTNYPEHEKQRAVLEEAEAIGRFLDESGYILAEWQDEGWVEPRLFPVSKSIQNILADYFDINLDKLEDEKRQMLEELRSLNA